MGLEGVTGIELKHKRILIAMNEPRRLGKYVILPCNLHDYNIIDRVDLSHDETIKSYTSKLQCVDYVEVQLNIHMGAWHAILHTCMQINYCKGNYEL